MNYLLIQMFYFSDLWSKMLAADVYSAFQESQSSGEESLTKIGKRFKETFLCSGGSVSANEVFRRFRGRDPSHKALVKSLNLKPWKVECLTWADCKFFEFEWHWIIQCLLTFNIMLSMINTHFKISLKTRAAVNTQ